MHAHEGSGSGAEPERTVTVAILRSRARPGRRAGRGREGTNNARVMITSALFVLWRRGEISKRGNRVRRRLTWVAGQSFGTFRDECAGRDSRRRALRRSRQLVRWPEADPDIGCFVRSREPMPEFGSLLSCPRGDET